MSIERLVVTQSDVPDPAIGLLIDKVESFGQTYDRWMRRRLGDSQDGVTARLPASVPAARPRPAEDERPRQMRPHLAADADRVGGWAARRKALARRVAHETDRRATIVENHAGRL